MEPDGRGDVAAGGGDHVESALSVEANRGAVVAKEDFGVAGGRFPAPVIGDGRVHVADVGVAGKLRVLGAKEHFFAATLRVEFDGDCRG